MKKLLLLLTVALSLSTPAWAQTAECMDGTMSYSAHHRGTCSHHGGVKRWLDGSSSTATTSTTRTERSTSTAGVVADFPDSGGPSSPAGSSPAVINDPAPAPNSTPDLPNTGGTPWLFVALGSVVAGGGLLARKRLT